MKAALWYVLRIELSRIHLRWVVLRYGIYSAVFWTLVLVGAAWLKHLGLTPIVWILLTVWLLVSLPALIVQTSALVDILNYILSGEIFLLRRFITRSRMGARSPVGEPAPPTPAEALTHLRDTPQVPSGAMRALIRFASDTSPLAPLSTWALVVLFRLPTAALISRHAAASLPRVRHEAELYVAEELTRGRWPRVTESPPLTKYPAA